MELPRLQSLVNVGGTYDAPAHHIAFSGLQFSGTSWLGPAATRATPTSRPAPTSTGTWDRPVGRADLLPERLPAVRGDPPALEPDARRPCRSRPPTTSPSPATGSSTSGRTASASATTPTPTPPASASAPSNITVDRQRLRPATRRGGIVVGGVQADAHHPSDSRMTNRDITISNNLIHDVGAGVPRHRRAPGHLRQRRHHLPQRGLQPALLRHRHRLRLGRQRRRRQPRLRQPRPVQLPAPLPDPDHRR